MLKWGNKGWVFIALRQQKMLFISSSQWLSTYADVVKGHFSLKENCDSCMWVLTGGWIDIASLFPELCKSLHLWLGLYHWVLVLKMI